MGIIIIRCLTMFLLSTLMVTANTGCNPMDKVAFEESVAEQEAYEERIEEEGKSKKEEEEELARQEKIKAEAQAKVDAMKEEMAVKKSKEIEEEAISLKDKFSTAGLEFNVVDFKYGINNIHDVVTFRYISAYASTIQYQDLIKWDITTIGDWMKENTDMDFIIRVESSDGVCYAEYDGVYYDYK